MGRRSWIVVSLIWGALVFTMVFWLLFPSTAVANRIRYEVARSNAGRTVVQMSSVSPWWVGLSVHNVIVSSLDNPADPDALPMPFFAADRLAVRFQPISLLREAPKIFFAMELGDGLLEGSARSMSISQMGDLKAFDAQGDDVPFDELLGLFGAGGGDFAMDTTGGIDLDLDMKLGRGLAKADGDMSISGRDLVIDTLTVATLGWEDEAMNALVNELDFRVQITEGQGTITRGVLSSTLIDIEVEGDFTLSDALDRSSVELEVILELKDWTGTPLESFRGVVDGFLGSAKWKDGTAHYTANTTLGRLSLSALRPKMERTSGRVTAPITRPTLPTPAYTPPDGREIGGRISPNRTETETEAVRRPSMDELAAEEDEFPEDEGDFPEDEPLEDDEEFEDIPEDDADY